MRMSDQNTPVLICTDATLVMGILSSELPKNRGLIRSTRSGPTSIRVGKRKLPRVHRLAWNTLLELELRGGVDMEPFYAARLQSPFLYPGRPSAFVFRDSVRLSHH